MVLCTAITVGEARCRSGRPHPPGSAPLTQESSPLCQPGLTNPIPSTYVDWMGNRLLLACGMVAGPLFTIAYLLEGAARLDCKALRHPVSSLTLGRAGWAQIVNFLCAGLLSLIFAVGLWHVGPSRWGALLIGVWAVALLGAAPGEQTR